MWFKIKARLNVQRHKPGWIQFKTQHGPGLQDVEKFHTRTETP